jgi:prohibitin 2
MPVESSTFASFQNERGRIQLVMEDYLRLKLEGPLKDGKSGVYAKAISLQLRNIELPREYQAAVAEKQGAAEDIELAKNQRIQEMTKADTLLLTSQEEARKILDTAANDANVTLTEAALKAQEIVFSFETEAQVLLEAQTTLGLTTDGLLAYLTNRMYETVSILHVSAGEPARLSRKDEL